MIVKTFENFSNDKLISDSLLVVNKHTKYLRDIKNDLVSAIKTRKISKELYEYLKNKYKTLKGKINHNTVKEIDDYKKALYELKDRVIAKADPEIITYHTFKTGDVRPLYRLGDYTFHGKDIKENTLSAIKYRKPNIGLTVQDAIKILLDYLEEQ